MIDPQTVLAPGERISIPHEIMNQIVGVLGELPANRVLDLIVSIREQAEVIKDPAPPDIEP